MLEEGARGGDRRPLNGWRAIAGYLGRNQSTVRRWSVEQDLPIHRPAGWSGERAPVYAYPDELDAWLRRERAHELADGPAGPEPLAQPDEPAASGPTRRRVILGAALGAAGLLAAGAGLWLARDGAEAAHGVPEEAYALHVHGAALLNRRTPEAIREAIAAFGRAIAIHPDYAEAHAGLATSYNLARQYAAMPGWQAYPRAEAAARRALEIDPGLDLALSALALVEFHWHWNVAGGIARFEHALRLNPDSADTLTGYAGALLHAGRWEETLPVITRAGELDPGNGAILDIRAQALFFLGEEDEALDIVRAQLAEDADFAWAYHALHLFALARADYRGFIENYTRFGRLVGTARHEAAAEAGSRALDQDGPEAMARAMLAVERGFYDGGEALAWDLARYPAMIGETEDALRWLRISLSRREEKLIGIRIDPAFWPIREQEGYAALLADIGLAASA